MTDLEPILTLWRELESASADYVLATVVAVEGSSYRRPGARMILAQDGRRVGTVSGGCLEAEVAKRAWWLTSAGPLVERFSTIEDDGERPYGSGCGGLVSILLERRSTAAPVLAALHQAFTARIPLAIATILAGPRLGHRAFARTLGAPGPCVRTWESTTIDSVGAPGPCFRTWESTTIHSQGASAERVGHHEIQPNTLDSLAQSAFDCRASLDDTLDLDGEPTRVWAEYRPARPGLWIFGAGDDARPLQRLARELGWYAAIADGRSHLATRDRFPSADVTTIIDISALPGPGLAHLDLHSTDAAVIMTHSFEQDSRVLASLLALDEPLAYIGVLGPQRRTREMLAEAAHLLDIPVDGSLIDQWLARIHAPTGLDLGAETPAAIALSILSEIQQTLNHATGQPLRVVRAAKLDALTG
jgi:xanthine dehydrogenase accessory factor